MAENRFLLMDVGAGTLDILYYNMDSHQHFKAVVRSPVQALAQQISKIPGDLIITGCEMGGGAVSAVLKQRAAQGDRIMISRQAAVTLHHDLDRVKSWGIEVLEDSQVGEVIEKKTASMIEIGDLQIERIAQIVKGFGVAWEFDAIAVCAQDHGVAPKGVSHLDYRHNLFQKKLDQDPSPSRLLYSANEVPKTMNRLTAIAQSAQKLPANEIYVMDSGMAAILGASMDIQLKGKKNFMVLDIATSHTVGAAMSEQKIDGFFEYHTHDITSEKISILLKSLAEGNLSHSEILKEGGHGAYLRKYKGFNAMEAIVATGPKRSMITDSSLDISWGAVLGDNMMTGTVGLLEALRQKKELPACLYV